MEGVMRRPFGYLPWISAFPEINLRIYVEHDGKPGVWFLSLHATNPLAVWAAQKFFSLPYYKADISITREQGRFGYGVRRSEQPAPVSFEAAFEPSGEVYRAEPGSLEHWLTERYCLYATDERGVLYRTDVHHEPWPLQAARAEFDVNTIADSHGLALEGPPSLLHFSKRIDVVVWNPVLAE